MVKFTPRSQNARFNLNKRLGDSQSQYEQFEEEINVLPLPGMETRFRSHPAHSIVTVLSTLVVLPFLYTWHQKPSGGD